MSDTQHPNYRLQDLQRRWEQDPSSRVYQQLADEYRKAGQLVEAAVVLEDGLGRRPNDIAGRVALGRCRLELGQVPEAVEVLQNVITRDAAHHVANKLLLDAYLKAGDLIQARERLTIYRLINDGDPEIEELGRRLQQLENSSVGPPADDLPSSTTAPPAARSDAEVAVSEAEPSGLESLAAGSLAADPEDEDVVAGVAAPVVKESSQAVVTNRPQEFLKMPNHAPDPKVNDVFDFGHQAPPTDSFASLWADLEKIVPSIAAEAGPSDVTDLEIETAENIVTTSAAPQDAASAAESGAPVPSLSEEPFGDLVSSPLAPPGDSEQGDVWQHLAQSLPVAEEPGRGPDDGASAGEGVQAAAEPEAADPDTETVSLRSEAEPAAMPTAAEPGMAEDHAEDFLNAPTMPIPPSPALAEPPASVDDVDDAAVTEESSADHIEELVARHGDASGGVDVAEDAAGDSIEELGVEASSADEDAAPTVTLGSLYLKQGHREEAAGIFEEILRKEPGHQAALAGLNLARKPESSGLSAMDLLADRSLSGTIPAAVTAQKILVLNNYLQHLKARSKENHVH